MLSRLYQLAAAQGIEREYLDIEDRLIKVDDRTLEALLQALGADGEDVAAPEPASSRGDGGACHLPSFLDPGRSWGVACQVYGLRSDRNLGIGDFEDLARLGEAMAGAGADFLGVNPLHALFTAAPERCSPFSPSNRLTLNPLLIAVDRVQGFEPADVDDAVLSELREAPLVDYPRVTALKLSALRRIFDRSRPVAERDLDALRARHGRPLADHALFEAASAEMAARGHGAGWHGWPDGWRRPDAPEVLAFGHDRFGEVAFHLWLQLVAESQLAEVAARIERAGMRIGLYLDLAVGVAPDGSATWSDPELTVAGVRIGAPPDMFNAEGQDWGLAPLAPRALLERGMQPVRELYDGVLRHAGALRIDHAMSLQRLYWIPQAAAAAGGTYVRYPMERLLSELADASRRHHAVVIGEDLGVVPKGFRETMRRHRILSYRVLMFERGPSGFTPPEDWPVDALACVATHDTSTFAGWWTGSDIGVRRDLGLYDEAAAETVRRQRERERAELAALLRRSGLLQARRNTRYSATLAAAVHGLAASTPCRLFVAQVEDLIGLADQPNVPGTVDEHPNWRRRLPVPVEDIPGRPEARAVLSAIAAARPRT